MPDTSQSSFGPHWSFLTLFHPTNPPHTLARGTWTPPSPGLSRPGVYTTAHYMVRPTTCFKVRVLPTIYGYYVLHTCSTGTSTWSGLRGSTRPASPQSLDRGCPQGRLQSPLWRCTHSVSLVRLFQGTVVACMAMAEPIRTDHTTNSPIAGRCSASTR